MFATSVRPEDLCITNELISESIKENGDIEWRSQKEFLQYLEDGKDLIEWCVIGWISTKTLKKWGITPEIKSINIRNEKEDDYWILSRGKEYWFVRTFVL